VKCSEIESPDDGIIVTRFEESKRENNHRLLGRAPMGLLTPGALFVQDGKRPRITVNIPITFQRIDVIERKPLHGIAHNSWNHGALRDMVNNG
jgi:hypothetical protein